MLYRYLPSRNNSFTPPPIEFPDDTNNYGRLTAGQQSNDLRYVSLFYEKISPTPSSKARVVYDLMNIQNDVPASTTVQMGALGGTIGFAFDDQRTLYINSTASTGSTSAGQNYISWSTDNSLSLSPVANISVPQVMAYKNWSLYYSINGPSGSDYSVRMEAASASGFHSSLTKVNRSGLVETVLDHTIIPIFGKLDVNAYSHQIGRLAMDFLSPTRAILNVAVTALTGYRDKTYLLDTSTVPYSIVYETPDDYHLGYSNAIVKALGPDRFCIISCKNTGSIIRYFSATSSSFTELPVVGSPPEAPLLVNTYMNSATVVGPNKDHLHILLNSSSGTNRGTREALYKITRDSLEMVKMSKPLFGEDPNGRYGYLTFPMADGRMFVSRNRASVNNVYNYSVSIVDFSSVL